MVPAHFSFKKFVAVLAVATVGSVYMSDDSSLGRGESGASDNVYIPAANTVME